MADIETVTLPEIRVTASPEATPEMRVSLQAAETMYQPTDRTLSNDGQPADAKTVGDRFGTVETTVSGLAEGLADAQEDIGEINTALGGLVPKTDIETTLQTTGKVADSKAAGDAIAAVDQRVDALSDTVDGLIAGALDTTLTVAGKVADAKATGDALDDLETDLTGAIATAKSEAITDARSGVVLQVEGIAPAGAAQNVDLSTVLPKRKVITVTITAGMTVYTVSDAWITADADCYCHDLDAVGVSVSVGWVIQAGMVTFTLGAALSADLTFHFGMIKGGV